MKRIIKMTAVLMGAITIGGVIAGIKALNEMKKSAHRPYGVYEKYFKRPIDFILSAWALIVLSPMMAVIAVLVRIKLGAPVLFRQERPGKDEKVFTLYKYRSMSSERGEDGELLPDEERLGAFGKTLRSTSMDELPEIYCILKGDMSIVGPRPLIPRYLPYFTKEEKQRHDVRPGLTGLAQTSGRNALSWDERLALDVEYVNHITFKTDVQIIWRTIKKVLEEEGVVVRGTEGSVLDFDVEREIALK